MPSLVAPSTWKPMEMSEHAGVDGMAGFFLSYVGV